MAIDFSTIGSMPMITPITTGAGLDALPFGDQLPFKNVLEQALQNVEETQAVKDRDSHNLALGDVDDLAAVMINSEKADLAVQTLVQMRNKILDAYTEIMRINV